MAYPFRAILSPIQFDDLSLPALGFAKSIAKDQGATLHLLHVVAVVSALGEPAINAMLHSRAEEKAIEALNDIAAKHLEGVSYVIHTRFATHKGLARAINEVAAEIDADLIVLKTHGRHGITHLILGSVAEEVVRSAPCAVLSLTPTVISWQQQLGDNRRTLDQACLGCIVAMAILWARPTSRVLFARAKT